MKYFIHFETNMRDNFKYWKPLFNQFINRANTIKIDCWNKEKDTIAFLKLLGKQIISIDTEDNPLMTIFMIKNTNDTLKHLFNDPLTKEKILKYFTLSLWFDNLELISFEHNGNECTVCNINFNEIDKYMPYIPKSSSIIIHDEEGIVYKQNK